MVLRVYIGLALSSTADLWTIVLIDGIILPWIGIQTQEQGNTSTEGSVVVNALTRGAEEELITFIVLVLLYFSEYSAFGSY